MDIDNSKGISTKTIWLLFSIAAISFIFTLNLSPIGEEGVYTISSFEMWYNKHYIYPLLYGGNYGRPPFYNWLIISLSKITSWSYMLLAARLITATATIGTGLVLAWLVRNIFNDRRFAVFSALAYLTTDALFYHGWLAYSDPLFSFCIFAAIACLWISCERESRGLLLIAISALTAAFLTKALTAYAFYMVAFILLFCLGKRKFLLHRTSIILHLIALSMPLLWSVVTNNANGGGLLRDIYYWAWQAGQNTEIKAYLIQLIAFPFEAFVRMLPVSLLAIYYFWRSHGKLEKQHENTIKFLILFIGISFFPYLVATKHSIRYILPLYPFMTLWCSYIIWRVNTHAIRITLIWFVAAIIIKYFSVIFWWPYYQTYYRGDYVQVAQDVVGRTHNYPIYANDAGATEHCVFYNVNILRHPLPPVKSIGFHPAEEKDYFVFTTTNSLNSSKIAQEYILGKNKKELYLLCYGKACF